MNRTTAIELLEHHKKWLEEPPTYGQCSLIAEAIGYALELMKEKNNED